MEKTKIITLCGSSKFCDIMAVCAWLIERDEQAVTMGLHLLPGWYSKKSMPDHLAEHEGVADAMDKLHLRKIDISDEIFIVNCRDYIGDSTANEIKYARENNKKIRWFSCDPVGKKVLNIIDNALKPSAFAPLRETLFEDPESRTI